MSSDQNLQRAFGLLQAGEQAVAARDRMRAVNAIRQLLAAPVPLGEHWKRAVSTAHQVGDIDAAVEASRHLCREEPDALGSWMILANMLEVYGDPAEGFKVLNPLLKRFPKHPDLHFLAGHLGAMAGKKARAIKILRAGLKADPHHARTHYNLSLISNMAEDPAGFDQICRAGEAHASSGRNTIERAAIGYALAKSHADRGEHQASAESYEQAAALQSEREPWELRAAEQEVDGLIELYTRDFVARFADAGIADERPVFILGAPRSGTTLVEQILAAHSGVKGGGEHGLFAFSAIPLDPQTGGAVQRYLSTTRPGEDRWATLGQRYLQFVETRLGKAKRWTDKNLGNYRYLGAAALALPQARFIWVRRDPMDVAWSAWRTFFSNSMGWSYEPKALAGFLKLYDRAMTHWAGLFPDRMHVIDYADLIAESDAQIAALLEFCGLDDQVATRQFHRSGRAVATASFDQVRQPIHSKSVGAWKAFMPHNAALRDAVREAGLEFDDL